MKFYSLVLTIFLTIANAYSHGGIVEEEVYINGISDSDFRLILQNSDLTVDHKSSLGFELYGPIGMKTWLRDIGVSFIEVKHSETKSLSDIASYPSFKKVEANLKKFVAMNPKIAKLISIGKSVQGRDLWVVKISDNVEIDEKEPEFKYISSMHGDEITGRELTQFLVRDIIKAYGVDQRITELVNSTEIYIMPSMNPDGSERKQRRNSNNVDLNRNFPDWFRGDTNNQAKRQPETKAIMDFQKSRKFSLSANFHGGAVVVYYPWDNTHDKHPLDKLVRELSLHYAKANTTMYESTEFTDGVTNGAAWYVLKGGMQDWSYYFYNDLQVTVELSDTKWPSYSHIPSFYRDNKESMLTYMEYVHQGAGFFFSGSEAGTVKITEIRNSGLIDRGSFGFSGGEFYKILPIGTYSFEIETKSGRYFDKEFKVLKEISLEERFISL